MKVKEPEKEQVKTKRRKLIGKGTLGDEKVNPVQLK